MFRGQRAEVRDQRAEIRGQKSEIGGQGIKRIEEDMVVRINSSKELTVYREAYALSMKIFRVSRDWPAEERYSLIDQIRKMLGGMLKNPKPFIITPDL